MSLLLDALKRAEQEKQARPAERAPAAAMPGSTPRPALELAPVAPTESAASARAAPAPQPLPAAKVQPRWRSRTVLWIALCAILVAIAGGAAYVWYAIASLSPARPAPGVSAPRPIVPAPDPVAIGIAPGAALPSPPNAAPKIEVPAAVPDARGPRASRQRSGAETEPATDARAEAAAPLLQPTRPEQRARILPQVAAGYAALRGGDLAAARREYGAALAADATSLDATLGLATVEARSGKAQAATDLYRRALQIDPRNATAIAGLAALSDLSRGDLTEQQILRELAQHPGAAPLHFMLGNVYASQSQWTQAQAAYFEAYRLDPANPDILHNLAVSLDRLGQARTAASFYRRALEASGSQATAFDAGAVSKRLAEIDSGR